MKKPKHYETKKWLCKNTIIGIEVNYHQTGTDTAETFWTLTTYSGEQKEFRAPLISKFINIDPLHSSIAGIDKSFSDEIKEYDKFVKENDAELKEYERLKAKFENQ